MRQEKTRHHPGLQKPVLSGDDFCPGPLTPPLRSHAANRLPSGSFLNVRDGSRDPALARCQRAPLGAVDTTERAGDSVSVPRHAARPPRAAGDGGTGFTDEGAGRRKRSHTEAQGLTRPGRVPPENQPVSFQRAISLLGSIPTDLLAFVLFGCFMLSVWLAVFSFILCTYDASWNSAAGAPVSFLPSETWNFRHGPCLTSP